MCAFAVAGATPALARWKFIGPRPVKDKPVAKTPTVPRWMFASPKPARPDDTLEEVPRWMFQQQEAPSTVMAEGKEKHREQR